MIDIIYEDNHLLVVNKPINMPMQEDSSKDEDLLSYLKKYLKDKYQKPGNVYLGIVHRLDRPVGGICVFAKTSKAANRLSQLVASRKFDKEYLAVVLDNNLKDSDCLIDKLLKDPKTNTTKVDPRGKDAKLTYEKLSSKDNLALVKIKLYTGRSHQIRVQFASRNHPLYGDQRYNKYVKPRQQIALFAYKLTFKHPTKDEILSFKIKPDQYPFSEFMEVIDHV